MLLSQLERVLKYQKHKNFVHFSFEINSGDTPEYVSVTTLSKSGAYSHNIYSPFRGIDPMEQAIKHIESDCSEIENEDLL